MKLRLLVAAVVLLAAVPAAQANDPPYPACSPATPFTWHAGARIFATSAYVVSLHTDATEVWARVGAAGTWQRAPVRHDRHGTWTRIRPALGAGDLAIGFRSVHAGSPCLALEERHFTVKRSVQLDRVRAVPHGGVLQLFGFRAGRGCHSLGAGGFGWQFPAGGKSRAVGFGDACGPLDGAGVPIRGARVRTTFFTVVVGTAARAAAPASYLEVRAAHPRRSGKVRFNLTASLRGASVPIGVTVTVHYQPDAHRKWRTAVRFGRAFDLGSGGGASLPGGGGSGTGGGGGVSLPGTGSGDSPSGSNDPACTGLSC